MPISVYIPTPFRRLVGNQIHVKAEGKTVAEVLESLGTQYPALRHMIYDDTEEIPGHINIYVNNQEINALQGKDTPVKDGDEVAVIPAIAGGQVLTPEQVTRYSRHIIMPQVGPVGQRKLMA
ncbi:MAG TPA: ubiquitin-like small modifier protein 1, partial [Dehalococcoidia bacterium]|nr:ubiquitin-like small modifier protein 1 [Dehalococcoidia bacterium]